ncbi:unnamed protein product [Bemisia tabaci]|uniref:HTH psq-type domain-containing protein n=1 Tax=Bemisia tabaci TaxID=7038 RepID=A0A9P0F0M3_BEMTA|nr:unnamed protein product [Bemisia tabaci]
MKAKKLESSQAWLCASTSSGPVADADTPLALTKDDSTAVESALDLACSPPLGSSPGGSGGPALKLKAPTWSQGQLQEAIQAVVTQQLRFTTAAARYGIPKGTLYDNILGKTKRMMILEKLALTPEEEVHILEFCCEISLSPYNRRTRKSLAEVLAFVTELRRRRDPSFAFEGLSGFRWWWAFCKKHCIVSLYFDSRCPPGSQGSPGPSEIDENNAEGLLGPTAGGGPPRKLYFDLEPLAINYSTKKKREDRVVFADSQIETKANSEMDQKMRVTSSKIVKPPHPTVSPGNFLPGAVAVVVAEQLPLEPIRDEQPPVPRARAAEDVALGDDGRGDHVRAQPGALPLAGRPQVRHSLPDLHLRPKGRGRPQRILLGYWPEKHIQKVIAAVVFKDPQLMRDEPTTQSYNRYPEPLSLYSGCMNGPEAPVSPSSHASSILAAVHSANQIRQQMYNAAPAASNVLPALANGTPSQSPVNSSSSSPVSNNNLEEELDDIVSRSTPTSDSNRDQPLPLVIDQRSE